MIDYRAPLADILFALEFGAGAARLPHWDGEIVRHAMSEAARFVDAEIAPLDPVADAEHSRLVEGRVRVPDEFVAAYAKFRDSGWPSLAAPEEYGGQGQPHVLAAALSEMLSGACVTYQMILSLAQGAMRAIQLHGSDAQKKEWMPKLASGQWLATMCLTEAQAGSDLGQARTKAAPLGGDRYALTGGKVFTSAGDQNMTADILHLVLARTPDAPPGAKGLSLFLCPTRLPDGRRNAVACVRLEDKMGMHASPTCQMAFDGAEAEIVGRPGEGLARMFTMMNAERLDVGIQGVGLIEIAAQRSRAYAADRKQGRAGKGEGPDPINRHGDVRRMLLEQTALAYACRALLYRTDVELELGGNPALVEFMTPVCKAFATDGALAAASNAIQIHGGYGYLKEYRVEQIYRDARITPIYEGTNGIQAMTLATRQLRIDNGAGPRAFAADVEAADRSGRLGPALADWRRATDALLTLADPSLAAVPYMRLTGLVAGGAALARLEAAADAAPNPPRLRAAAQFYRDHMLYETSALADRIATKSQPPAWDGAVFAD